MLTVAYMGGGGVKNGQNHAYVICGRPLSRNLVKNANDNGCKISEYELIR